MEISFDQEKLEKMAIDAIVERFFDTHYDLKQEIQAILASKIDQQFGSLIEDKVLAKIDECLVDAFNKEYHKRTAWGEPQGEPTSIAKELERVFQGYWQEKVDSNGKATKSGYGTIPRSEWVLKCIATDEFMSMVKQDIVSMGGMAKDTLRGELRKALDGMLNEVFHVKSLVDQAEKSGGYGRPEAKSGPKKG